MGDVRALWDANALREMDRRRAAHLDHFRELLFEACRAIVVAFSPDSDASKN